MPVALNDPVNLADPNGDCPNCVPIISGALVGGGTSVGIGWGTAAFTGRKYTVNNGLRDFAIAGAIGAVTGGAGAWLRTGAGPGGSARRPAPVPARPGAAAGCCRTGWRGSNIGGRVVHRARAGADGTAYPRGDGPARTPGPGAGLAGGAATRHPGTTGVRVILNSNGDVVTVILGR
ncbi:hypothetical protein [Salinispora oceanensis]|uniref:hypothetical protein n=1 Tax=Salinispora oceanensis TaxID=1050199 RepID=UPI00037006D7|nr:hypothetical protein [Salinispora oceanensis]